jgi:hypothetical protein
VFDSDQAKSLVEGTNTFLAKPINLNSQLKEMDGNTAGIAVDL